MTDFNTRYYYNFDDLAYHHLKNPNIYGCMSQVFLMPIEQKSSILSIYVFISHAAHIPGVLSSNSKRQPPLWYVLLTEKIFSTEFYVPGINVCSGNVFCFLPFNIIYILSGVHLSHQYCMLQTAKLFYSMIASQMSIVILIILQNY